MADSLPDREPILCRDCLADHAAGAGRPVSRCPNCGSPRLLRHPERDRLAIAHVDCDAFFAAIEKRDDPSLADKAVIIGGGKRGVVSTACYVARTFGVRSAMPMFKALQACPGAVVIKPNIGKYAEVGRQVRDMMRSLTPLVEAISIDEAFLDLAGTERLHHASPAATLARFARRVEAEIGISVSVGLSYNKFLAKIASDLDKPRGFSILGRADALDFLAPRPVSIFHGVGKAAQARLGRAGFRTVADLRRAPPGRLVALLGKEGERLGRLAHGIDDRPVRPERETKSISAETTFDVDIADRQTLEPILWRLAEKVSARLKRAGLAGRSVTLKLKTDDFRVRTRSRSGFAPTQLAGRLYAIGHDLLADACDGTPFRLIGIGASDLTDARRAGRGDLVDGGGLAGRGDWADGGDLADPGARRQAAAERAVDNLRQRFGDGAVVKGITLRGRPRS